MTVFFRALLAVFLILAPAAAQRSTQGEPDIQPHRRAAEGWLDRRVEQSDADAGR